MSPHVIFWSIFLSLLPIAELRGGIPFAVLNGASIPLAYLICVSANALVGPLLFLFLSTLHKLLTPWKFYNRLFEKFVERTRHKVHAKIEKYGYLGITIFVAIPLPITGAYTGALGAWILGMEKIKTFLACLIGVMISGTIVSIVMYFGPSTFSFLYDIIIKQVH